jgi:hypothetical protein
MPVIYKYYVDRTSSVFLITFYTYMVGFDLTKQEKKLSKKINILFEIKNKIDQSMVENGINKIRYFSGISLSWRKVVFP